MNARKTAAKKATAKKTRKTAAKKAPAKKAAKKAAPAKVKKVTAVREKYTKTQILNQIATNTDLSRKQVQSVMDELTDIIEGHIKKRAVGEFALPGLMKITTVKKPAKKARKGINPFTGEETMFKAKPASIQVKIRPLKKMKEMAES
ncbi:HU family DNA-binding protein [Microbulbifer sp. 2201CG32-9]|uniref:HU family DNA-binding protein n=1 Tax=unclassified Microbulbifer TaxID=2619833 RepID=UPI00345C61CA